MIFIRLWMFFAGVLAAVFLGWAALVRLAPVLIIAFACGFSLIGFHLIMTLQPHYANTLLGWYFHVGAFYAMLAVLAIASALFRTPEILNAAIYRRFPIAALSAIPAPRHH